MELLALADRPLTRRNLDPRWTRSHAGRFVERDVDAKRNVEPRSDSSRCQRDVLSDRRGAWSTSLWLRNRPFWTEEIIFYHGGGLFDRNRALSLLVEFLELRTFPRDHRRRNRRRICRDQFSNRRIDSGARARPRWLNDQRFLLGRRGSRLGRNCVPARSRASADLVGLALGVRDRSNARPHRNFLSPLDSGKPAMVDDSWTKRRSGENCRRSRTKNLAFGGHRPPLQ